MNMQSSQFNLGQMVKSGLLEVQCTYLPLGGDTHVINNCYFSLLPARRAEVVVLKSWNKHRKQI